MVFLPIAGLALGAAGMYLFDPEQGRRRRALVRDQAASRTRRLRRSAQGTWHDLRNRARGARHKWGGMRQNEIPDRVLAERVRSKLGRHSAHPRPIEVWARSGTVELRGPVLDGECDQLVRMVRRMRGVHEVRDRMQRHDGPEHVSALQGGSPRREERAAWARQRWSPAQRAASGGAGGALLLLAMRRGGIPGALAGLAGAALLVRAATNAPLQRLAGTATRQGETHTDPAREQP